MSACFKSAQHLRPERPLPAWFRAARVRSKHKPPLRRPELWNGPGPAKEGSSSSNSGFPSMTVPVCLRCAVASSPSRVALKTPSMPRESGLHQGSARKEMDVEKHPFLTFVLLTTVHSNKQHYDITVLYKMTQTLVFNTLLVFDASFIDPYLILNCFKRRLNYLFILEIWWIFLIWGLEHACKVSRHGCVLERRKTIWRLQWCWGQTESHWFACNSPKITTGSQKIFSF